LDNINAGGTSINGMFTHFINTNLPFGGVGPSGVGSYHGLNSFYAFSFKQSVNHSKMPLLKFQFPNSKKGLRIIRRLYKDK
jgi:aldehyde dehydrogenase (NAD+)